MKPTHKKKKREQRLITRRGKILQTRHAAPAHTKYSSDKSGVGPPRISDPKPRPPISPDAQDPRFFFLHPGYENATFKKGNSRLDLLGKENKGKKEEDDASWS